MTTTLATIFRYFTLRVCRTLGGMSYWLRHEWRPALIGLIVTVLIVCLLNPVHNAKAEPWYQEWWAVLSAQWWTVLVVYTLLVLILWVWRARKRVVIEDFTDYTRNPSKSASAGLATLLVVRLAQLQELYRVVDEQRALSTEAKSNQAIDATIKVEDVSNFLSSAISAQSKFSLGPVEIPVGTLMSLLGRLVQGPRILGSVHKDNDVLILTAQRVGYETAYSWRVDRKLLPSTADSDTYDLDDMVNELALRMFTDLALSGSVRWRATATFSEGLQYYRDCLRTPAGRRLKLKQAEKKFIETLGEDREFASANYNLGVLYMN
jgi:succinate dehydrogenase hydrophobic anchor subunit